MSTLTFDQTLAAARQLPPRERARLVALVVAELAEPAAPAPSSTPADALDDLEQLISDAAAAGPVAVDSAHLISEMRR